MQLRSIVGRSLAHAHRRSMVAGSPSASAKVAYFLLEMGERLPWRPGEARAGWIALPMNRSDIADYLGLSLETTCRTLHALRRGGLIELSGTRRIDLRNPAALRRIANAISSETVHARPARPG